MSYSTSHVYSYTSGLKLRLQLVTSNVVKFNLLASSLNLVTSILYTFTTPLSLVTVIVTSFNPSVRLSGLFITTLLVCTSGVALTVKLVMLFLTVNV